MSGRIDARLRELGLELPPAHQPVANYVGFVITGRQIHVSGVGPTWGQSVRHAGKLGGELSYEDGYQAARLTALNLLAHAKVACGGDLDRIECCVKLLCLVNAVPDYMDAQMAADGATDLLTEIFGADKRPARTTTAVPSLPFDIAFEADGIFLIR